MNEIPGNISKIIYCIGLIQAAYVISLGGFESFFIRVRDILFSVLLIVFFGPLMFLIAVAVFIDMRGMILQKRKYIYRNGRKLETLVFRTVKNNLKLTNPDGKASGNINFGYTKLGKFLRRTSLDGLPEIFYVLKGDLTF